MSNFGGPTGGFTIYFSTLNLYRPLNNFLKFHKFCDRELITSRRSNILMELHMENCSWRMSTWLLCLLVFGLHLILIYFSQCIVWSYHQECYLFPFICFFSSILHFYNTIFFFKMKLKRTTVIVKQTISFN